MIKPITPQDIASYKEETFPPEVFKAWNELIASEFNGSSATIFLSRAKSHLQAYLSIHDIRYDQKYLDIEDVYRNFGWNVSYVNAAYNDAFESYYEFEPK